MKNYVFKIEGEPDCTPKKQFTQERAEHFAKAMMLARKKDVTYIAQGEPGQKIIHYAEFKPCQNCNGSGEVVEWDFGYNGLLLLDCDVCNGLGKVKITPQNTL